MMSALDARLLRLRRLLIALNSVNKVQRSDLYRLGGQTSWLARQGTGSSGLTERPPTRAVLDRVRDRLRDYDAVAAHQEALARKADARIVTRVEAIYPPSLFDLDLPPPVLYVRGDLPTSPALSIVGSRKADRYGIDVARGFARQLAEAGLTVVSGLAAGIDSAAHRGAIDAAGGTTVAALGCGIDIEYPRGSRELALRIAAAGAVISEFPIGARPHRHHFPIRNHLIAALGLGTLVVRATPRSGSLITARLALDLGREVYGVPGNVFDTRSVGPNSLIRDGAYPIQHPREILESLPIHIQDQLSPADEPRQQPPPPDARLRSALEALPPGEASSPEEFAGALGRSLSEALALLMELELGGWIDREPGPVFVRKNPSSSI